jgi:hypothetical protein
MARQSVGSDRPRQIRPTGSFEMPTIKLPGGRWVLLIPGAVILLVAVIAALGFLNPPDVTLNTNAIWLMNDWTYTQRSDEDLAQLAATLQENRVGTVYAYVSSLREDATWASADSIARFNTVEAAVIDFAARFKQAYPDVALYAWIEVQASTTEGYRLDSPQVQRVVADFSQRTIDVMQFDGVLLDVKPIFDGNPDFPALLQAVRRNIGLDTSLAVAVPADLTPTDAGIVLPPQIAPDTVWSLAYKQRIALQADSLVVTAYNSYLNNPVDYMTWVSYQVNAYLAAMSAIDTTSQLVISVPQYADRQPAHNATVESLAGALDGVSQAFGALTDAQRALFKGIAIFADRPLTDEDWRIFREKWVGF